MRKTSICVYTVFCIFVLGVCVLYVGNKLINILKKKNVDQTNAALMSRKDLFHNIKKCI